MRERTCGQRPRLWTAERLAAGAGRRIGPGRQPAALLALLVEEVEGVDDVLEEESFDDDDEEDEEDEDSLDDDEGVVDESLLFAEPFAPARLSVR